MKKIIGLVLVSTLMTACGMTQKNTKTTDAFANRAPVYQTVKFTVHTASAKPFANAHKVQYQGQSYYMSRNPVIKKEDIKTAFVSKTVRDEPALGVRLMPNSAKYFTKLLRSLRTKGDSFMVTVDGDTIARLNLDQATLQDEVLLVPTPSLVYARNIARLIRQRE
ncbi:hypothetical protein [Basilea psittacipulmonis]|uniref:hypothetical protein n=1 Tax=Basilea psittacipulmonis TaxID=1472345 RepID=UPI00117870F6|nr:hypothetical protein [Basilea psittacipulmonis]